MNRVRLCSLLTAAGVSLLAVPARGDDRATAQRLFEEGQALFKQGKTAEACAKFEGAAGLVSSPGVRLNLARCWEKVGRTASAWTKYDEALVAAERSGDRAAAAAARQGRAALEPRLTKLVISFADPSAASGVEITRDGETLPASVVGSDLPVDPGEHEVGARAAGFKPWSTKVNVAGEGATVRVSIPALEKEPTPPAVAETPPATGAAPPAPGPAGPAPGHTLAIAGIATGAVGLVGLGLGTYFGLAAQSKWHQANRSGGACADAACPGLTQQASNDASLSTVFFVAGGVLAAAGVTLWIVAPKGGSSEHAALTPVVGPDVAGLGLGGTFR
ncbi:MAG: CDC27 family protein [Polyangiaceae bacterium]